MSRAYAAVYLRRSEPGWPYDLGDDPSFEAASQHAIDGGVLSWGICRRNLRNPVKPGDVVIFFAADRFADRRPEPVRYAFVGFATVDRKISQVQIWEDDQFAVFRGYRNLLIRPDGDGGYRHYEPIPHQFWHPDDWLWRMTNLPGVKQPQLQELNALHRWHRSASHNGRPVKIAANYVLFRPEGTATFVADNPPIIAWAHENGRPETWLDTAAAQSLREIILGDAKNNRAGLRTTNEQTAHPHIPLTSHAALVTRRLQEWCSTFGVMPRTRH